MSTWHFFLVFIGGGIGSSARWFLGNILPPIHTNQFPLSTFLINIFGSFLIGVLYCLSLKNSEWLSWGRPMLIVGFCGGFTTFSTFSLEIFKFFQLGQYFTFFGYTFLSVLLCFLAVMSGILLTQTLR